MAEQELWDVYTKDRQLTGRTHRRGDPMKPGEYHLTVHVCVFNSKNQLLIQQRQPFKQGFPNMWDITAGGSALAGESSAQAAEREAFEEVGLRLDLSRARPCFSVSFPEGFGDYYLVEKEVEVSELKLQETEVRQVRWAGKEEVLRMREEGTMMPYWFLEELFALRAYESAFRKKAAEIEIVPASRENLASWMSLVEIVGQDFPGLETAEERDGYRNTVLKKMDQGSAICALDQKTVVGILLFSVSQNMLCCLAVHPEYRRRKIASRLIQEMFAKLDQSRDITVETFREGEEKGIAARRLYQSLGFVPDRTYLFEGSYPVQIFVRKGRKV